MLEELASSLVGPVHEIRWGSNLDTLIRLAASIQTNMWTAFAKFRARFLLDIQVNAIEKGLLHERCEPTEVPAFRE